MLKLFRAKTFLKDYRKFREFHVSGDLLVLYSIEDETLKLIRIGSHSELFD